MSNIKTCNPVTLTDDSFPNPNIQTWVQQYQTLSLRELGETPGSHLYERSCTYYYYVVQDPTVRTADIQVPFHYRGINPTHGELSQYLETDLFRAICWKESSWRQFGGQQTPLFNKNKNGTTDWGCMQINNPQPIEIWDWRENVNRAKKLFATKQRLAKTYLEKHKPVTAEMILRETIQRYNGGVYYKYDAKNGKWVAAPPDGETGYVYLVLKLIDDRPWDAFV
jgi:hypothetical protein